MNSWRKPEDLKQQQNDYATKLQAMDDAALRSECNQYIWLSAYTSNNPRSDFHWKLMSVIAALSLRFTIRSTRN